jgi:DNA polymerase sigma
MNLPITKIKNCLRYYDDKSAFENYEIIAKKYYKIYNNLMKNKKYEEFQGHKLKEEIKRWFFSLSLETRMKISTIENEFICKILYQMFRMISWNNTMFFKTKNLFSNERINQTSTSTISNLSNNICDVETEDGIIYPPNKSRVNVIKVTKEKKNKTIESQTVVFNQENLDNFSDEELLDFNIGNFFKFRNEKSERNKIPIQILNDILFFSVHRKNYPDCITLSPNFLLKEDYFENCFKMADPHYFYKLIQPYYNNELKEYSYYLPYWIDNDTFYSPIQFIFCFFEQTILIKYLLNHNPRKKNNEIIFHSLINNDYLERFFNDRKNVIMYLNEYYDMESRINIFNETISIKDLYDLNINDKKKKNYIQFWRSHPKHQLNDFMHFKNYSREMKESEVEKEIKQIICSKGNIFFIDYLIFQNFNNLWKIQYFVNYSIFDKLVNLNIEQTYLDLIAEDDKKDKKKEKANKNKTNNKKVDEEYEFYIPYYNNTNSNVHLVLENNKKINNKKNEKEIYKYIKNEIIYNIISKALITQPDNYVDFFNEIEQNNNIHIIKGIKDIESNNCEISSSKNLKKKNLKINKQNSENLNEIKNKANDIIDNKQIKKTKSPKNNISVIEKGNESLGVINITGNVDLNNNNNSSSEKNNNKETKIFFPLKPKKDKKKKEQNFFLFDTIKKKKPKKVEYKRNNIFTIISPKKNEKLNFYEKLHNDMIKYDNNISEILAMENNIKEYCIKEIKNIIKKSFVKENEYSLDLYGSFASDLMIEISDIDLKIRLNSENKEKLEKTFFIVSKTLSEEEKINNISPISTASVPIIKLNIDPNNFIKGNNELENEMKNFINCNAYKNYKFDKSELNKIKIDITFILNNNEKNINVSSVDYTKDKIYKNPEIKVILRVLKRFFHMKKMNNSFNGGLSSHNLFLIILSYIQYLNVNNLKNNNFYIHNNSKEDNNNNQVKISNLNLGKIFFDFLEFFGNIFNFKNYIIDVNSPTVYNLINGDGFHENSSLMILDPLTALNASKSSYKIDEIQTTFFEAYEFLRKEKIEFEKNQHITNNNKDINNESGNEKINLIYKMLSNKD